jgi:hypothetical protein
MSAIPQINESAIYTPSDVNTITNGMTTTAAVVSSFALATIFLPLLIGRSIIEGVREGVHENKSFSQNFFGGLTGALVCPIITVWMTYKNSYCRAYKEGFEGTYKSFHIIVQLLITSKAWCKMEEKSS